MTENKECFFCRGEVNDYAINCCHCGKRIVSDADIERYALLSVWSGCLFFIFSIIAITIPFFLLMGCWICSLLASAFIFYIIRFSHHDYVKLKKTKPKTLYGRYLYRKKEIIDCYKIFILTPILIIISSLFILIILVFLLAISNPGIEDFKFRYKESINYSEYKKFNYVVASIYCNQQITHYAYLGFLGNFFKIKQKITVEECKDTLRITDKIEEKLNKFILDNSNQSKI